MIPCRRIILVLSFISLAAMAGAQENRLQPAGRVPHIGLLGYDADSNLIDAFRQGMRELGRVEGRDYVIDYRTSETRVNDLSSRAAELVRLKVDVILTSGTPSVRAAKQATSTIPIVMVSVGLDPVQLGIVQSLAHPGGNVTGVASLGVELWAKRLQLLQEAVPNFSRIVILSNPSNPGNVLAAQEVEKAAKAAGLKVHFAAANGADELERAFGDISAESPEALVVAWDIFLQAHAREIGDFAIKRRIPTMTAIKEYVQAGALMSYGPKVPDQWKRAAWYVDRILKGAKPADLPVEQPTVFELVINGKTARALGLTIPPELLLIADKVIE